MKRSQKAAILKDLEKKMVLLCGPRQAGKTWLAKNIASEFKHSVYLNYDNLEDRDIIQSHGWMSNTELLVLDELHKMPDWKNYLKGLYDTKPETMRLLVTGSARLEIFHQVGDSLAGRFFMHRLMPLSPAEITSTQGKDAVDIDHFLKRGGFPEPFLANTTVDANRWRTQYIDSLMRTDVLDFDNINNLRTIQLVFELLRRRVGSPVSYLSIAEDAAISPTTVKKYIHILEALYIVFRVTPYSKNIARSLLKEPKLYFFDTGLVKGNTGAVFENFMAVCLLKHVYGKVDYEAEPYALHYLRTKDKREVDFALVCDDKIETLIEVKHADKSLSPQLLYFHKKHQLPAIQIVKELRNNRTQQGVSILKASDFLTELYL